METSPSGNTYRRRRDDDPDTARAALRAMIPGEQQDRLHWRGEREPRRRRPL